jgi:hypothetical protein
VWGEAKVRTEAWVLTEGVAAGDATSGKVLERTISILSQADLTVLAAAIVLEATIA